MLVLTRRAGESLKIGDDVTITILGIGTSQVRIGVTAPQETPVHRQEVYHRVKATEALRKVR